MLEIFATKESDGSLLVVEPTYQRYNIEQAKSILAELLLRREREVAEYDKQIELLTAVVAKGEELGCK